MARGLLAQPNDFAEAPWLRGFQFGFVRRGLIGEILWPSTPVARTPITASVIATLAQSTFACFTIMIVRLPLPIVRNSGWSSGRAPRAAVNVRVACRAARSSPV